MDGDLLQKRYAALNEVERRIVDNYRNGGYSLEESLDFIDNDLADAAEEDGYDGPCSRTLGSHCRRP